MTHHVSVVGAGFVGLAHAILLSKFYQRVSLVDRDEGLVERLKKAQIDVLTEDEGLLKHGKHAIENRLIIPTTDLEEIGSSDSIFVAVGFDFQAGTNGYENLSTLFKAIGRFSKKDSLIVFESTVPPGVTEKFVLPAISDGRDNQQISEIKLVYAYERVMPGPEYLSSLEQLPKVFSSNTASAKIDYLAHLAKALPGLNNIYLPNIVSAETAKLIENTYRLVNIALVSEFVEFGQHLGADVVAILDAVRQRPTHSNIRYVGQSPGGYCLTKDPEFLFESMKQNGVHADLDIIRSAISASSKQNVMAYEYVKSRINLSECCVILGIAYRSGVGDVRESSALELATQLIQDGVDLRIVDPFVDLQKVQGISQSQFGSAGSESQAILAVRHSAFNLEYLSQFKTLVDINSGLTVAERQTLRERGLEVSQLGEFV